jgi:protein lifeguard
MEEPSIILHPEPKRIDEKNRLKGKNAGLRVKKSSSSSSSSSSIQNAREDLPNSEFYRESQPNPDLKANFNYNQVNPSIPVYANYNQANPQPYGNYNQPAPNIQVVIKDPYEVRRSDMPQNTNSYSMNTGWIYSHFANRTDRNNFITKVYALFFMQILLTEVLVAIIISIPALKTGIRATWIPFLIAVIFQIVLGCAILCFRRVSRKYPRNYIALFSFSIIEAYILAYIPAGYNWYVPLYAGVSALFIDGSIAFYALVIKTEFSRCKAMVISVVTSLIIFGVFIVIFPDRYISLIVGIIISIIFSVFITLDAGSITSRYSGLTYDDYVIAALILYIDFIILLLELMGKSK